ncbi:MAG: histidinol dehydrogenase, partial [Alphaproteobacteria bacterium]|nr:histidinol dehydrogenase [Alphaproteobacteria bacterium]
MPIRLNSADRNFEADFANLLTMQRGQMADVTKIVADIIADIRANGDKALLDLTAKLDGFDLTLDSLRIHTDEIEAAEANCDPETLAALDIAATRITAFHTRQKPTDDYYTDELGLALGYRWQAVAAAGLYVPGGTANYPSSVLMNALPAKIAGVERLVMVVPSPQGEINPLVLAAARRAQVDEIYRIGGAQAIAALAYGTQTIAPVDMIVGPGNAYVAEAKRQLFGQVGIDMLAGPTEILIVADSTNDPSWIAADLLAQAEHDIAAQSILLTDNPAFAEAVIDQIEAQLK